LKYCSQGNNQGYSREFLNLTKMYTEENKYSSKSDNFDFKLLIFNDIYSRADVLEEAKLKAYPIMLHGLALDYYYTSIKGAIAIFNLSFKQACKATRNYFEGVKHKCSILSK
jgi:hypothetical protein